MNPMTEQTMFVLACVGVIAVLVIATILLGWDTGDARRNRQFRIARTAAKVLSVVTILVIAWRIKHG